LGFFSKTGFLTLFHGEPEYANLLRYQGIESQPGGIYSLESIPGLLKRLQSRTL